MRRTPRPGMPSVAATLVCLAAGALTASGAGCREEAPEPAFARHFEPSGALRVVPIEPFRRRPRSLLALPDGRFVLPEAGGVWLHVVDGEGRGITRLGGEIRATPGTSGARPGTFRAISSAALDASGRLLVADASTNVVTVFDRGLEPAGVFTLPETRGVQDLEALPDGRMAAAVWPRHPMAGGQLLIFTPPAELSPAEGTPPVALDASQVRSLLPQEPIFRYNRWAHASATGLEALEDGRLLAYWPALPWARLVSAEGDSLPRIGRLSSRYEPPSSGPRDGAPAQAVRAWLASFTPLIGVETAGPALVFQYLSADTAGAATQEQARERRGGAAPGTPRTIFVNLYDASGLQIARDVVLPPGSRVLDTNDPSRLYLLTAVSPRELAIDVWRTNARRPEASAD